MRNRATGAREASRLERRNVNKGIGTSPVLCGRSTLTVLPSPINLRTRPEVWRSRTRSCLGTDRQANRKSVRRLVHRTEEGVESLLKYFKVFSTFYIYMKVQSFGINF